MTKTEKSARKMMSRPRSLSNVKLDEMIEEAIVDAYGDSEQLVAFYTMLEDNLTVPFETVMLGVEVTVERIDMTYDDTKGDLLSDVLAFERGSLAGEYYDSFNVNSQNNHGDHRSAHGTAISLAERQHPLQARQQGAGSAAAPMEIRDPQSGHNQQSPIGVLQRRDTRSVEAGTAHVTRPLFGALGSRGSAFRAPARAISCSAEGAKALANFQPTP